MEDTIRKFIPIFLILCCTLLFPSVRAEIINVPDDFETIQGGIDASEDGDTVLVAPGEYVENINFSGKAISVIGNPDDPSETIINGDEQDRVVIFDHREEENSELIGFTITNGDGGIRCNGASPTLSDLLIVGNRAENIGGGVWFNGGHAVISRSIIRENFAGTGDWGSGGGIASTGSSARILDVVISDNEAVNCGGGLYIEGSGPQLTQTLIANNTATTAGAFFHSGAVYSSTFDRVTITGNTSEQYTIWLSQADFYQHSVNFVNTIIWDNDPNIILISPGEEEDLRLTLNVSYCNIEEGQEGIVIPEQFDNILNWDDGNIDSDPLFADPDEGDYHLTEDSPCVDAGDPDSPEDPDGTRADMGTFFFPQQNISVEPDTISIETPGTIDSAAVTIYNIGLDTLQVDSQFITPEENSFTIGSGGGEFSLAPDSDHLIWIVFTPARQADYEAVLIIESNDRDQGELEIPIIGSSLGVTDATSDIPFEFSLQAPFPNPFNSATTIRYSLPSPATVTLGVYDLAGRRVSKLIDGYMQAGFHNVTLNAGDLPSGMYIVHLESADRSQIRKIVLIR